MTMTCAPRANLPQTNYSLAPNLTDQRVGFVASLRDAQVASRITIKQCDAAIVKTANHKAIVA
jgi:hypothetical protein